jgi:hypothetical protein
MDFPQHGEVFYFYDQALNRSCRMNFYFLMKERPRISYKYGSLTRIKFLVKSVTTLKQHDVYSKYASFPRFQIDVC